MSKMIIVEGNSNDKDNTRVIMVKGEKGEQGDVSLSQLNEEVTERKNADSNLQNQITGLASGSPLVANSTSEMTDTSKTYVNTTDGKWYYYNGSNWVAGGTYQSSGINPDDANLINMVRGASFVTDENIDTNTNNLTTITANRIYIYYVTSNTVTNLPNDIGVINNKNLFLVYKLSITSSSNTYVMHLIDLTYSTILKKFNNYYVGTYNEVEGQFRWNKLTNTGITITTDRYISSSTVTDENKNLNNILENSITAMYLKGNQFLNAPVDMTSSNYYYLTVLTFGWNSNFYSQICIDSIGNNKFYYRSYVSGTWSNWIELNNQSADLSKIEEFIDYSYLTTIIQEPIDLNNKAFTFCGDSITAGNFIGSGNVWAKWLTDKYNTTYNNKAVGGSTFGTHEGYGVIGNQIKSGTNNPILFIAGGINDYVLKTSKADFTSALEDICSWLNTNYTGKVIFVTPINHIHIGYDNTVPLNWYREEITRIALLNGHSVIAGNEIGFPTKSGDMSTLLFYDTVHPSVDGQKMYANKVYQLLK